MKEKEMANNAFKKVESIKGSFKGVMVQDGKFFDYETGEFVDVAAIAEKCMGNMPFDMTLAVKSEEELDGSI